MVDDIRLFAVEFIKRSSQVRFSRSYAGRAFDGMRDTAKSLFGRIGPAVDDITPTSSQRKKTYKSISDSLLGVAAKGAVGGALSAGSLAGKLVTSKGVDGKRKLNLLKATMISAPVYGAYKGIDKGKMRNKASKYYGQKKSDQVYFDPRRRLR